MLALDLNRNRQVHGSIDPPSLKPSRGSINCAARSGLSVLEAVCREGFCGKQTDFKN